VIIHSRHIQVIPSPLLSIKWIICETAIRYSYKIENALDQLFCRLNVSDNAFQNLSEEFCHGTHSLFCTISPKEWDGEKNAILWWTWITRRSFCT
jgi:hypothetical protein